MSEKFRSAKTAVIQLDDCDDSLWARFKASEKVPSWMKKVNWPLIFGVIVWYALSTTYILQNKVFVNVVPLHYTCSGFQLILGAVICLLFWGCGFRAIPRITNWRKAVKAFLPLGVCHLIVHYGAVISMAIGDVSATQVIKAGEPVFTAVLSIIFLRDILNIYAYLSLIPIVVGIGMATFNGLDFAWLPFLYAMLSNVGSSARAIIAKVTITNKEEIGQDLTAANIYMILTVISGILSVPLILVMEASVWKEVWEKSTVGMTGWKKTDLLGRALIAALSYYAYNDVAFYCLGQMNQVTHSITNTMKRVIVIVFSIIMFNTQVTWVKGTGMVMAVVGAFVYSLAKQGLFSPKKPVDIEKKAAASAEKGPSTV